MNKKNQNGNVLFLILIAVALFAALSYAVTQSTRTGGNSDRETNLLNSAQLTSYPNSIKTAVLRMIIDGTNITNIKFNAPSALSSVTTLSEAVFHPDGGGAVFQEASPDLMDGSSPGTWIFNMNFEIPEIGVSTSSSVSGNELIAFLPGITLSICQRINLEAGITASLASAPPTTPDISGSSGGYAEQMDHSYSTPTTETTLDSSGNDYTGKAFGCFDNNGSGTYVYYHVINER